MTVRTGDMRHRVTFNVPSTAVDAMGQSIETFGTPFTRWAAVEDLPAGEQQMFEGTTDKKRILITIRNPVQGSKLVTTSQRLSWQALQFNVISIREIGPTRAFLELTAEAVV